MELNINLLRFMQKLTVTLEPYIKNISYEEYVHKTLEITSKSIDSFSESDPDLLYSRLENMDEEDILSYFELDINTEPTVWSCIANFLALVCYYSYRITGEKYLPETIESIDEKTIEDYFDSYKKLIGSHQELLKLKNSLKNEKYIDDKLTFRYYKDLFEAWD